jgi:ribose/xylose/arabinose/galactoside ABC-type transport system permease subunit
MRLFSSDPHFKPLLLLAAVIVGIAVVDFGHGRFLSVATAAGILETFGTIGPVALGLGITMVLGEFDLSAPGIFGMAGCIAVLTGVEHPLLGLLLATTAGLAAGGIQGLIIHRLQLTSVAVTLGGLLIAVGVAYVLTKSASISYDNLGVALWMGGRYGGVLSVRSAITLACFVVAAVIAGSTRIGRDIIATGSNRSAAIVSGVNVAGLTIGVFAASGALAALSGALLSFSLASASPAGLSDVLVPAATAAIIGGVSLGGGTGRPLGIAAGVLTLATLRSGFNAIGAEPWVSELTTSLVLLAFAAADTAAFARHLRGLLRFVGPQVERK